MPPNETTTPVETATTATLGTTNTRAIKLAAKNKDAAIMEVRSSIDLAYQTVITESNALQRAAHGVMVLNSKRVLPSAKWIEILQHKTEAMTSTLDEVAKLCLVPVPDKVKGQTEPANYRQDKKVYTNKKALLREAVFFAAILITNKVSPTAKWNTTGSYFVVPHKVLFDTTTHKTLGKPYWPLDGLHRNAMEVKSTGILTVTCTVSTVTAKYKPKKGKDDGSAASSQSITKSSLRAIAEGFTKKIKAMQKNNELTELNAEDQKALTSILITSLSVNGMSHKVTNGKVVSVTDKTPRKKLAPEFNKAVGS